MVLNKNIVIAILWIWCGSAVGHTEIVPFDKHTHLAEKALRMMGIEPHRSLLLAQNDKNSNSSGNQSATSTPVTGVEDNSDSESDQTGSRPKEKTTPLKPFTPSEKIKADQGVDFPVDI